MPNRCNNKLEIKTTAPLAEVFDEINGEFYVHFAKIAPAQAETVDAQAQARGTKRDVFDADDLNVSPKLENDSERYYVFFDTARSPPIEYYQKLYDKLLELDIDAQVNAYYMEGGVGFCGQWSNGCDDEHGFTDVHYIEGLECYLVMDDSITYIFDQVGDEYVTKDVALEQAIATEDQETIDEVKRILSSYNTDDFQTQNQ